MWKANESFLIEENFLPPICSTVIKESFFLLLESQKDVAYKVETDGNGVPGL